MSKDTHTTTGSTLLAVGLAGYSTRPEPSRSSGAPLYRYQPQLASGSCMQVTGLVSFSQNHHQSEARVRAGQTWSFQCWYRDSGGPCGFTSNLTNALTVTFRP